MKTTLAALALALTASTALRIGGGVVTAAALVPLVNMPGEGAALYDAARAMCAMMVDLGDRFPGYGFARHKGYGTALHQHALAALGPISIHRLSFAPLQRLGAGGPGSMARADQETDQ